MDDGFLQDLQTTFFAEGEELLEAMESSLLAVDPGKPDDESVNRIFRFFHNFKGSARSVGFTPLSEVAHRAEDILSRVKAGSLGFSPDIVRLMLRAVDALKADLTALKENPSHVGDNGALEKQLDRALDAQPQVTTPPPPTTFPLAPDEVANGPSAAASGIFEDSRPTDPIKPLAQATSVPPVTSASPHVPAKAAPSPTARSSDEVVRVPSARLDQLINIIGELVVNQTILNDHHQRQTTDSESSRSTIAYMAKLVAEVQTLAMSLRLVPVRPLFQKLNRAVHDVAAEVHKSVDFVTVGEHVEVDKIILEKMTDPLTHMVRNAVDHGIETDSERQAAGKPLKSTVTLAATQEDDRVIIKVSDDGKGLDRERILKKALANGLVSPGITLRDNELYALIFRAGFSTKDQVTTISGRGVGLEVVQKAVDELKGTIEIATSPGHGTTFSITLPLSLSVIGGMVVESGSRRYVVPVSQLLETIDLTKYRIEPSAGKDSMFDFRGEVLPLYSLANLLGGKPALRSSGKRPALIAAHRGRKVAFEIDAVVGQQHVVLKRLGPEFSRLPGILGGAILSSGDPGLVLNLYDLIPDGARHVS